MLPDRPRLNRTRSSIWSIAVTVSTGTTAAAATLSIERHLKRGWLRASSSLDFDAGDPTWRKPRAIGSLPCPPGGGQDKDGEFRPSFLCWHRGPALRLRRVFPGMCPHGDVRAAAMTVRAMVAWYAALARPAALPETHLSRGGGLLLSAWTWVLVVTRAIRRVVPAWYLDGGGEVCARGPGRRLVGQAPRRACGWDLDSRLVWCTSRAGRVRRLATGRPVGRPVPGPARWLRRPRPARRRRRSG